MASHHILHFITSPHPLQRFCYGRTAPLSPVLHSVVTEGTSAVAETHTPPAVAGNEGSLSRSVEYAVSSMGMKRAVFAGWRWAAKHRQEDAEIHSMVAQGLRGNWSDDQWARFDVMLFEPLAESDSEGSDTTSSTTASSCDDMFGWSCPLCIAVQCVCLAATSAEEDFHRVQLLLHTRLR